jgi:cysteine synthase A
MSSALEAIGHTPVMQLERLVDAEAAEVWVKLEGGNPTGSYKDRMALAMIEGAERSGVLRPGQVVVEYTGGSTGSSLAFVCALKGYPLRIVSSDAFAEEKLATMRAFGADVEVVHSPEGITPDLIPRLQARAAEIVDAVGGYATDQFNNRDMIDGYRALGRELLDQLGGRIDAFCAYIGTAGCFLGVTRELRETLPDLHRVAVEPGESPVLSGGAPGTHHIEGGGAGFRPPQLREEDHDEVIAVPEAETFETAREAARREGLLFGAFHRREPCGGAVPRAAARAGPARRDGRGRFRAQVPERRRLPRIGFRLIV